MISFLFVGSVARPAKPLPGAPNPPADGFAGIGHRQPSPGAAFWGVNGLEADMARFGDRTIGPCRRCRADWHSVPVAMVVRLYRSSTYIRVRCGQGIPRGVFGQEPLPVVRTAASASTTPGGEKGFRVKRRDRGAAKLDTGGPGGFLRSTVMVKEPLTVSFSISYVLR